MNDKNNIRIECISSVDKKNFEKYAQQIKDDYADTNVFIFGAGIIGIQFAEILMISEVSNTVYFVDNNHEKWGTEIINHKIISCEQMDNIVKTQNGIVFIAMENYHMVEEQITQLGMKKNEDFFILTEGRIEKNIPMVKSALGKEILLLGDCNMINVSINENNSKSIEEMLCEHFGDKFGSISRSNLYLKTYYFILKQILLSGAKNIEQIVCIVGTETFSGRYSYYPEVQQCDMLREIMKDGVDDAECKSIITESEEREAKNSISGASPNRIENDKEKIERNKKIHLKLNYMYNISNSETGEYLDKFNDLCNTSGIKVLYVVMPVNYSEAERICGEEFRLRYEKICNEIGKEIDLMDMSYELDKDKFISIYSINEGIYEAGRRIVADRIINGIGNV